MFFNLRLIKNNTSVEFTTTHGSFRSCVINAFNQFISIGSEVEAEFELKHKVHGWVRVCYQGVYTTVRSPMHLDFVSLRNGVYQTHQQADTWPTESQKAIAKQKALRQERLDEAERRRNRFFVVH